MSLSDLANDLAQADEHDVAAFLATLDPDELEAVEAAMGMAERDAALGAQAAAGWRANPATMANYLSNGEYRLYPYVMLMAERFVEAFAYVTQPAYPGGDVKPVEGCVPKQQWWVPSQYGKTSGLMRGVIWALDQNPRLRLMYVSYDADKAVEEAGNARDLIEDKSADLRFRLRADRRARGMWRTAQGGGLYAVGINGGITGWPADGILCLAAGTLVETPSGPVTVDRLSRDGGQVWSYDHDTGNVVASRVLASRTSVSDDLVEVRFRSGRSFVCTADHPVWVEGRGYTPAARLQPGSATVLRVLRQRDGQTGPPNVPDVRGSGTARLLQDGPEISPLGEPGLRLLRKTVPSGRLRLRQIAEAGRATVLLLAALRRRLARHPTDNAAMPTMRGSDRVHERSTVLPAMPDRGAGGSLSPTDTSRDLPALRVDVSADEQPTQVLLPGLRRPGSFAADAGRGELAFQGRPVLHGPVLQDAPADKGTRRRRLHRLSPRHGEDRRSPLRQQPREQRTNQPRHLVQRLPHSAPQVGIDTVSVVRRLRGKSVTVYDLQVEGTSNLFAEGILVHNCDDLIKGWQSAHSDAQRNMVWRIYTSQVRFRLQSFWCPIIVANTRWHVDDVPGRLRAAEKEAGSDKWKILRLPTIAEAPDPKSDDPLLREPDPLGREPGELLEPRRFDEQEVDARRATAGTYLFNCIELQRPGPPEGNEILRHWFKVSAELPPAFDEVILSCDMKLKEKESGDYVVVQTWGRTGSHFWMWAQLRGQWNQPTTENAIALAAVREPRLQVAVVENTGNGPEVMEALRMAHDGYEVSDEIAGLLGMTDVERAAVQAVRRRGMPNLVPENVKGDKAVRLRAHSGIIEAGSVHLWSGMPSIGVFLDEVGAFPNGAFDDQCLPAGTLVLRPDGPVPVETVSVGDVVWGESGWVEVSAAGQTGVEPVIDRGWLAATALHPVWTARGWVPFHAVRERDQMWVCASLLSAVAKVRWQETGPRLHAGPEPVFNLTTSDGTYFADGVLVHNCDALSQALKRLRHGESGLVMPQGQAPRPGRPTVTSAPSSVLNRSLPPTVRSAPLPRPVTPAADVEPGGEAPAGRSPRLPFRRNGTA